METNRNEKKQQVLTKWLDAHGDYLYRYALVRVRDAAAAEDLLQETLLAAIAAQNSHEDPERNWLAGILKQKILDHFRCIARTPDFQSSTNEAPDLFEETGIWQGHWREDCAPLSWPTDLRAQSCDFWSTLDRCLSCLPQRMAIAFTLRELDRLSTKQICEILDVNTDELRLILHCGRVKLRQLLEAEWIRSCDPALPANIENAGRRSFNAPVAADSLYHAAPP